MGIELRERRGYQPYQSKTVNALLMVGLALGLLAAFAIGQSKVREPDPASSDGRYHKCGLVTEEGVTEHLAAYWERCPDERP